MTHEKGVVRAVLAPALLAMGVVGAIAFFASREGDEPPAPGAVSGPPAQVPAASAAAPAAQRGADPAPAPGSTAGTSAASPVSAPEERTRVAPIPVEAHDHANKMLLNSVLSAVEKGDLEHARWLRKQLEDPSVKAIIPKADIEALDLAIDCLDHAPDAREEARDYLQFATPSALSEAVKLACE